MNESGIRLAIAPIGWTNDDLPELGGQIPFEQCVSEMALAGFAGSEVGNKYPKDPAVLNKALALRGLTICNAWFSSFLTTKSYAVVEKVRREKLSFLDAVKLGAFTVPGDGSVDFAPVFSALKAGGYAGWWVVEAEQDPALANPLEYALKARKYIREKAGI